MATVYMRNLSKAPLQIIDDHKHFFRFFRVCGLFPITYENGKFEVHEKTCVIIRILWFVLHVIGMTVILFIKIRNIDTGGGTNNNSSIPKVTTGSAEPPKNSMANNQLEHDLNVYIIGSIGILMFILVDPVQTIILKKNMNILPTILKEIKHLENIKLGNQSSRMNIVSKIYQNENSETELKDLKNSSNGGYTNSLYVKDSSNSSTTRIQIDDTPDSNHNDEDQPANEKQCSKCYNMLRYTILGVSIVMFLISFVSGFFVAVSSQNNHMPHDIKDEWKFFGGLFYLVFPVLTTWFCVFFIGYQRKMYKVLTELPDDAFTNEDYIKDIGDYLETMQNISKMLIDNIYRFTFGINFALFVIFGTMSTFELMQGLGEVKKSSSKIEFGDIIYVFPIGICVFHIYISCQRSTSLITGQHDKLRYKLKGIMTSLLVDKMEQSIKNEKKFKRVELLYKNLKDFSPQAEVYGGFKVNYQLLSGMLLFIFTYSRIFYGYVEIPKNA